MCFPLGLEEAWITRTIPKLLYCRFKKNDGCYLSDNPFLVTFRSVVLK